MTTFVASQAFPKSFTFQVQEAFYFSSPPPSLVTFEEQVSHPLSYSIAKPRSQSR